MKISRYDQCPCGSGKEYRLCCIPKSIKEDGSVPITNEIQEIFDQENERFKAIMGRDISGDDPLMPTVLGMSESEYKRNVTEMLNEIGVDPRVIYAFNKLGYCIVEGEEIYSDEQIDQWNEAIEEYELKDINGEDLDSQIAYSSLDKVFQALEKIQFVYALIIRKYGNKSGSVDLIDMIKPSDYIIFCLTRNLKSLKAITLLAIDNFPEDAFNLTRTNFENYAEIVYAKYDSKNLINQLKAENGIYNGTYERKWKKLINKENGEVVNLKSNYEKVKLNPVFKKIDSNLYNLIYPMLSSFTHPDISTAIQYIDNRLGFTDLKENSNIDPLIIALILNFMIIHEIQELEYFMTSKEDLINLNKEIANTLKSVNEYIGKLNKDIQKRIEYTLKTYS